METSLRAKHLDARLAPASLSAEAPTVLVEAIRESYREAHSYSEADASVLEALGFWASLDGDVESDAGGHRNPARLPRLRRPLLRLHAAVRR